MYTKGPESYKRNWIYMYKAASAYEVWPQSVNGRFYTRGRIIRSQDG